MEEKQTISSNQFAHFNQEVLNHRYFSPQAIAEFEALLQATRTSARAEGAREELVSLSQTTVVENDVILRDMLKFRIEALTPPPAERY